MSLTSLPITTYNEQVTLKSINSCTVVCLLYVSTLPTSQGTVRMTSRTVTAHLTKLTKLTRR
jgi:hypothetical protein